MFHDTESCLTDSFVIQFYSLLSKGNNSNNFVPSFVEITKEEKGFNL